MSDALDSCNSSWNLPPSLVVGRDRMELSQMGLFLKYQMGQLRIIPGCPSHPKWYVLCSMLGWDGQLGFELSQMGLLGIISFYPKWYVGMGWTVGI